MQVFRMWATLTVPFPELDAISRYLDILFVFERGAAAGLWKADIWREGLYVCLSKPEPSPKMTPFLFAAEAN